MNSAQKKYKSGCLMSASPMGPWRGRSPKVGGHLGQRELGI